MRFFSYHHHFSELIHTQSERQFVAMIQERITYNLHFLFSERNNFETLLIEMVYNLGMWFEDFFFLTLDLHSSSPPISSHHLHVQQRGMRYISLIILDKLREENKKVCMSESKKICMSIFLKRFVNKFWLLKCLIISVLITLHFKTICSQSVSDL